MLPSIVDEVTISTTVESSIVYPGSSFIFDFNKGDFDIKDGNLVSIKELDAVKMWISKVLRTEKFKFKIYERTNVKEEYGITLQNLIAGYDYPKEFIESEIKREVTEALLKHALIDNLENWSIEKNNPILNIFFTVVLKDGVTFSQEVSY